MNIRRIHIILAVVLLTVAGCASPEQRTERRAALNAQVFPNPADREGLLLAYPIESGGFLRTVLVDYIDDQVTTAEMARRVSGFCAAQGLSGQVTIKGDLGVERVTLDAGGAVNKRAIAYRCD